MVENDFISREELLRGGLPPGQRASALLFAIENRTAQLVAQAQRATAFYLTQKAVAEREIEFFAAFASGRQFPAQPKIQNLEKYAPNWADLVAEADPGLKAALAFALGTKYTFTTELVPQIRMALGLDLDEVGQVFHHLYNKPLSSIYQPAIPWKERLHWDFSRLGGRLEALPPFWIAFGLTIPLGSSLLALPIALAEVGPVVGIGLVLIFGFISALTTAALAEAVARSGTASFGLGYFGQLVSEYLGAAGSIFLTVALSIDGFLVLIIYCIGVAGTLEQTSRLPGGIWLVGLFGIVIFFLSRKTLSSTVASALAVGVINLILLVSLPLLALPHLQPANFAYRSVRLISEGSVNFSMVQSIFGVMIGNFSAHLLIGNYGRVVLRRDPSARTWIWGCLAAIGLAVLVSSLWVVAINGSISANALADQTGTALTALAQLVGPVANWLGSAFVVLSMGIGCVHISLSLFFLVDERLVVRSESTSTARRHFFLCAIPVLLAFLVAEWLIMRGEGSFTWLLGFVGIITLPLLVGVFPILLLASTRRKGDIVPGFVLKGLGSPVVLAGTYLLFVGSIFLHGLFAFQGYLERGLILLIGCAVLVMTGVMLRQGALTSRAVVELRQDLTKNEPPIFNLAAHGCPAISEVWLDYKDEAFHSLAATGQIPRFTSLSSIRVHLPVTGVDEIKVWAHQITPRGTSEALPARATVQMEDQLHKLDLSCSDGQDTFVVENEPCKLEIQLKARAEI